MNGIRPNEILQVLQSAEEFTARFPSDELILATVISLDGSVYTRAGAMALFVPGEAGGGAIPAQSLEQGLGKAIEDAAEERKSRLVCLDIGENDPILGYGFCAHGRVEVLLEPVDAALLEHLRKVRQACLNSEGVVCAVEVEGPEVGRRVLYSSDHPTARECYAESSPELTENRSGGVSRRTFLCPVHPMGKVLIFGSGPDAACLSDQLCGLGFSVFVADSRPGRLRNPNWERSRAVLVEGGWEQMRSRVQPDAESSVVILHHSLEADLEALRGALASPAAYVGLGGSLKRAQQFLSDLEAEGIRPRPGIFFAPAGLDVGAETPEETGLSIAEILAARSGRRGGRRSARARQEPEASQSGKGRLPGLILAAGRGKRFSGGSKLAALFEGQPVLRHVVENALASRLDPVIVVLGADAESGLHALEGIQDSRLRVVFNPHWQSGKASSIEVGLRQAPASAPAVVSLLGDMPRVKPWLIDRVIEEFELSGRLTFPIYAAADGPRKGYPTVFPRALFPEIKALTGDETAMEAVRGHWAEATKVPIRDNWTQADVDTAEDLQLLLGGASANE